MREAARVIKGHKVHPYVRMIVIPATQAIYKQCIKEGLVDIFIDAGAAFSTPTCGPCLGGHMGILAAGERAIATTNRNFVGRMGHPKSEVYLSNPGDRGRIGCARQDRKAGRTEVIIFTTETQTETRMTRMDEIDTMNRKLRSISVYISDKS